jgi:DNA-binding transcriptional LysR family regulator
MREADIALRMVRPEQSSLVAKHIGQMALRACASQSYLQRKGTPQQPADLLGHDLITGDRNTEIEDGFVALGFPASGLRHGLRTDDLNAQWAAVQAGLGVGFMSEHLIRTNPTVTAILPMIELPVLPLWLTVHRELRTSALMRAVFDFLAAEVPLVLQKQDGDRPHRVASC